MCFSPIQFDGVLCEVVCVYVCKQHNKYDEIVLIKHVDHASHENSRALSGLSTVVYTFVFHRTHFILANNRYGMHPVNYA